ncbi:MAG: bacteriochlorophyll 4-vinyl reductase [Pseudomonadota bacterium]
MADTSAKIGPNAILQLIPVLEDAAGKDWTAHVMAMAGVFELPEAKGGMVDEAPAARLHQAMRAEMPDVAPMLAREAGWRTGGYVLDNRIPKSAQTLLRVLPARVSAPMLAKSVAKHAWTFTGSGVFHLIDTWTPIFEIEDNPVVRGEDSDVPLCHWHAAVFERLFSTLCGKGWRAVETECCAQGAPACRFELTREKRVE